MARGRGEANPASYSCELNLGAMAPGLLSRIYTLKPLLIMAGPCLPTAHVGQRKIFGEGEKMAEVWLHRPTSPPALSCMAGASLHWGDTSLTSHEKNPADLSWLEICPSYGPKM